MVSKTKGEREERLDRTKKVKDNPGVPSTFEV